MIHSRAVLFFFIFLLLYPLSTVALDFPRGPVILTIQGSITRSNLTGEAVLDATMLKSLPQKQVLTVTPWTEGAVKFEGPLLRDVLTLVGAEGEVLKARAINDYFVDIPASDAFDYDVILAMRMNDNDMTIRSKGPLWVIYPWSSNDALRSETYYSRSIWQLVSIEVQ